jgi:hypothetical protein
VGSKGDINYDTYAEGYVVRPYIIYEDENGAECLVYGVTVDVSVFDVMYAVLRDGRNESDVAAVKGMLGNEAISDGYFKWQPTDGWYYGEEDLNDYSYSFAVIGDTQKTTRYFPEDLHYIYDWLIDNADDKNLQFVMGMGDITDIKEGSEAEWNLSAEQLARLEQAGIKQSIVRGNHDDEDWFDDYITVDKFGSGLGDINEVTYDGTLKNYYQLLEIGNVKYMIVTLDYNPDVNEIAWAKSVIDAHPDHNVILTTHSYFDHDLTLNDAGNSIYNAIVSKCNNVVLVLCGHRYPQDEEGDYGPRYTTVTRDDGSKVTQMMVNPQAYESTRNERTGMIAMLYFSEDGKNVQLKYFSARNEMYYKDNFQFEFTLDLVD